MADGDPTTFSERTARRVLRAMRKIEHLPTIEPDLSEPPREVGDVDTFVIASDPSEYSEAVDLLPLGYRGHVIAYRVPDEFDLKNLPVLPSLDTLLKKEAGKTGKKNVADWAEHSWIDTYEHAELGRPVLLNICRLTKGAFFRGQVVLAKYAGGFRHAGECRGSHFWYSAPTWGEWPTKAKAADHKYTVQPGWCVIDPGYTSLVVTLRTELDPSDEDQPYATADIKDHENVLGSGKNAVLVPPGETDDAEVPTVYVYLDEDETSTLPADTTQTVHWDQMRFRWQARPQTAANVVGPAVIRKMTLQGDQIWALDLPSGTGGAVTQVSEMVIANDTLIAITSNTQLAFVVDPDTGGVNRIISGSGGGATFPRVAANDEIVVTAAGNNSFDVHDHDGVLIWNNPTVNSSNNRAVAINPSDGWIYCTGASPTPGQNQDIYAYEVGNTSPQRTISFAVGTNDIKFDASGNLYAALDVNGGTEVRVFDSGGSSVWTYEHGGTVNAIAIDPNSGYTLIGGSGGTGNFTVRLLDTGGTVLWSVDSGTGALNSGSSRIVRDVAFDDDGNCYVTGDQSLFVAVAPLSSNAGDSSIATVSTTRKYDADGNLLWSFDFGANTNALVIDGDHLYVAGTRSTLKVNPVF